MIGANVNDKYIAEATKIIDKGKFYGIPKKVENIARTIAEKEKIKVFFGHQPCTTGEAIYLPHVKNTLSSKEYDVILGVLYHELGHVLFSDFDNIANNVNKLHGKYNKSYNHKFIKDIWNSLEDPRVDSLMIERMGGVKYYFLERKRYLQDMTMKNSVSDEKAMAINYALCQACRHSVMPELEDHPLHAQLQASNKYYDQFLKSIISVYRKVIANNKDVDFVYKATQEVMRRLADELEKIEKQEKQEKQDQQNQQQSQQPDPNGSPDDSDDDSDEDSDDDSNVQVGVAGTPQDEEDDEDEDGGGMSAGPDSDEDDDSDGDSDEDSDNDDEDDEDNEDASDGSDSDDDSDEDTSDDDDDSDDDEDFEADDEELDEDDDGADEDSEGEDSPDVNPDQDFLEDLMQDNWDSYSNSIEEDAEEDLMDQLCDNTAQDRQDNVNSQVDCDFCDGLNKDAGLGYSPAQVTQATIDKGVKESRALKRSLIQSFKSFKNCVTKNRQLEGVLDTKSLSRYVYNKEVDIFKKSKKAKKVNTALHLTLDCSGSMDDLFPQVQQIALAFDRATKALDITYSVSTFDNNVALVKTPRQTVDKDILKKIGAFGFTNLAKAIVTSCAWLYGHKEPRKILICVTDGCINYDIHRYHEEARQRGIEIYYVLIAEYQSSVESLLASSRTNIPEENTVCFSGEFTNEFLRHFEKILNNTNN